MTPRTLVIDANVLMRAVLGTRVPDLIDRFGKSVTFVAPEVAFDEVHEHLATVLGKRGAPPAASTLAAEKLRTLRNVVRAITRAEYTVMREPALARIGRRDPDDWPALACALALECPIWTEDRDYFGVGIATWTTANVEVFLNATAQDDPES
jgi:predicted nucleic acid-binding protein